MTLYLLLILLKHNQILPDYCIQSIESMAHLPVAVDIFFVPKNDVDCDWIVGHAVERIFLSLYTFIRLFMLLLGLLKSLLSPNDCIPTSSIYISVFPIFRWAILV